MNQFKTIKKVDIKKTETAGVKAYLTTLFNGTTVSNTNPATWYIRDNGVVIATIPEATYDDNEDAITAIIAALEELGFSLFINEAEEGTFYQIICENIGTINNGRTLKIEDPAYWGTILPETAFANGVDESVKATINNKAPYLIIGLLKAQQNKYVYQIDNVSIGLNTEAVVTNDDSITTNNDALGSNTSGVKSLINTDKILIEHSSISIIDSDLLRLGVSEIDLPFADKDTYLQALIMEFSH